MNLTVQGVSKILHKEMCDFLKMLPLALDLIKSKIHYLQKMLIVHENLKFLIARENFPLKKGNFWSWVKKNIDFFLINARANGNFFRVKKSHISLRCIFFETPCTLNHWTCKSNHYFYNCIEHVNMCKSNWRSDLNSYCQIEAYK